MDYPAGWTCQRTALQFESYLLKTLGWIDSLAIAEHLEACEGCAQRIVIFRVTIAEHPRG
jgi:hypothetical protein